MCSLFINLSFYSKTFRIYLPHAHKLFPPFLFVKSIIYSKHAEQRRKQRGFSPFVVEHILAHPKMTKKRLDNLTEVVGIFQQRSVIIIYLEKETYIKIVSII